MTTCPFDSVGLIVRNHQNQVLVLERKRIPLGLALPAGHRDVIDGQKEDWAIAARRELFEETGLKVIEMKMVLEQVFDNPCSKGFDSHHWQIFNVVQWEGELRLMEPDKHARVWWASPREIYNWIREGKPSDPAWLRFIFPGINLFDKLQT